MVTVNAYAADYLAHWYRGLKVPKPDVRTYFNKRRLTNERWGGVGNRLGASHGEDPTPCGDQDADPDAPMVFHAELRLVRTKRRARLCWLKKNSVRNKRR